MAFNILRRAIPPERSPNPYDNYIIGDEIGKGGSGTVFAIRCRLTRDCFAIKSISKKKYTRNKIFREILFLRDLDHPNIVKYHEFYENREDMFIVMEYAHGGELYSLLKKHGKFAERSARQVMMSLFDAVAYLHEKNIVHRDIKLENILLSSTITSRKPPFGSPYLSQISSTDVKLIDFGLAKRLSDAEERTITKCGSRLYVAPEVLLGGGYGTEVDVWGLGVVMYMLLTNTAPFYANKSRRLEQSILTAAYSLSSDKLKNVSDDAKNLVKKCFILNPAKRITALKGLRTSWMRNH